MMLFNDKDSGHLQFYFNVLIIEIAFPADTDIIPADIQEIWDLNAVTLANPYAIHIYRSLSLDADTAYEFDAIPHTAIEIDKNNSKVKWHEMINYLTDNPWNLEPIMEDFDYDDYD